MTEIIQAETPEQIAEARRLFEEYAASLGFSLCFQGFDRELAGLPGEYAAPRGRLLLVYVDGAPAGCAALHAFGNDGDCEVKRLFVRPAFRGHGLGRQLMDTVLEAARTIGYRRMLLDTVSGKMDKAIAMYRQYGFLEREPYRENPQPGVMYMQMKI
jgi:putative acetyltransferase